MPLIRQEEIYPVAETPWAQAIEAVATAAIAKDDIVILDGVTGVIPKASPADADNNVVGQLFVAAGKAAAAGDKLYLLPYRIVTGFDSSSAAVGDPIYLSAATAGAITLTKPTGADDIPVVVGVVLSAATDGVVRLDPGKAPRGLVKVGTAQIAGASPGGDSVTVSLGSNFADGLAVASISALSGSAATAAVYASIDSNGDLTLASDTAPGAGQTADVTYVAYSSAL